MNNVVYLLALHSIDGLGPIRLKAIIDYFKDPKLAWEAKAEEVRNLGLPQNVINLFLETRKRLDPESYAQSIKNSGINWVTIFDDDYSSLLRQIYDPPIVLYYKGKIKNWNNPAIAIVGSRKMTGYGRVVTERFTKELVASGLTIVSGLARGVDAKAHWTAVKEKGQTLAVLGGGLNQIYPPENRQLAEEIEQQGAVISEFPPDYPSLPGNFPQRNRIIAGLSKAVLVTEAASDSGSLITARLAVEGGREVFAVPGPITSSLSKGPIDLIKAGAKPIFEPQEILEELGIQNKVKATFHKELQLSEDERKVLEYLGEESHHIDEIGRMLSFPAAKISAILLKMEISGLVQGLGSGNYCKS
ncbi:DNA-protecting protein DprA [Candidatus Daviesbacteria bacterium]|nr:DNA-protecting protein DprA [Candidatus Daviesbacteria bacterium]